MNDVFLISCEHGGNEIPPEYQHLFHDAREALESHRGWDVGTLELARRFAQALASPLVENTISRLLIEVNRSPRHLKLFSEFSRSLPLIERAELVAKFYDPYRGKVEEHARAISDAGRTTIHISVHSFTPSLDGEERTADVGILYDPARAAETSLALAWQRKLQSARRDLRVRRNYPYLGKSDGLVTHLRRKFPGDRYVAIELEVNQKHPIAGGHEWKRLQEDLIASLPQNGS